MAAVVALLTFLCGALTASAQNSSSCAVGSATVSFGTVGIGALAGATSYGGSGVHCSYVQPSSTGFLYLCATIGAGSNSVSATNRTMKNGSYSLAYGLYTDAGMTMPYGPSSANSWQASALYSGTANGGGSAVPVYAKILPLASPVAPGTYTDTYSSASQDWIALNLNSTAANQCGIGSTPWGSAFPLTVSITVPPSCAVSTSALNFGSTTLMQSAINSSANFTVFCTFSTPYTVALGAGTGAGASAAMRYMTGPGGTIGYQLFQDNGFSLPWGYTAPPASGANTASGVGTGAAQTFTVYGLVPAQAPKAVGAYSDTVLVTVSY